VVEQLAQQHEVHVFAQTISHHFPGVTYRQVPKPLERPRWINQLYFAWKTWRATRTGFDIVHSHENTWHGNVHTVHVLPVKHTLFAGKQGFALALRWLKVLSSPRLLAYLWLEERRFAFAYKKKVVCASITLQRGRGARISKIAPDAGGHHARRGFSAGPGHTRCQGRSAASARRVDRRADASICRQ